MIEPKPVEKILVRLTEVWHLHVREQTIRTTAEHPFYVHDKAWVPAGQLQAGDWILTAAGDWKKVEEAWNTGEIETVYNLTVADWHTYFVGDEGWGWAAWAHNAYLKGAEQQYAEEGKAYVNRAIHWKEFIDPIYYAGITIAVSKLNNVEIVTLYATVGHSGNCVPQKIVDDFEKDVRSTGARFYHAYKSFHAEEILFEMAPRVHAIGISNYGGPCGACRGYFLRQKFLNIWWPPVV